MAQYLDYFIIIILYKEYMTEETKSVYWCINQVQKELAEQGISKDKTASTGGNGSYKFRGIDDIYNALSVIMAKHGLCILPSYSNKQIIERTSAKGNALFYTTIDGKFKFVSKHDGSFDTVDMVGEAMDSGDKGTNKAMSAAYKYACLQTFCIPTEAESKDSEQDTWDIKPYSGTKKAGVTSASTKKKLIEIKREMSACINLDELRAVWTEYSQDIADIKDFDDQSYLELFKTKAQVKKLHGGELSKEETEALQ
jgi:hypothetical protein